MATAHLDFGHGGSDPGAIGNNLQEKDLTLQIGTKVSNILKNHGVIVSHSRTCDKYLSLTERANIANRNGVDVFASIHINSFGKASANGVETFSSAGSHEGARLAKMVQDELVSAKLFRSNRGIKTANFTVLVKPKAPSILTELGFISNSEDAKVIKNKQNEVAVAVAKGILKYLNIKYKGSENKPSPSEPSKPSASNVTFYNKSKNNRGSGVVKLQKDLEELGYSVGRHGTNGIFGNDTESAVRRFQKDNGLTDDGSAGPATLEKIKQLLGKSTTSFQLTYRRPLKQGSNGGDVKELQKALVKLGYNPRGIDGNFGPGCDRSVREFQGKNGLSADGSVGPATVRKINELLRR